MSTEIKSDLNVTTGKRIKNLRKTNHWDQAYMAYLLDITASSYCKLESGVTDINFSRLQQIADIYKVNVVYLLSDNAEEDIAAMTTLARLDVLRLRELQIENLHEKIARLNRELDGEQLNEDYSAQHIVF